MSWWIYGIGCLVSFIIQMCMTKRYWENSDKTEKVLTTFLWIPFMTLISWMGIILMFGCALAHFNKLEGDE